MIYKPLWWEFLEIHCLFMIHKTYFKKLEKNQMSTDFKTKGKCFPIVRYYIAI